MKTIRNTQPLRSTYALLVRSEEDERSVSETIIYFLLIGSAAFAMWHAALQPFRVPVVVVNDSAAVAHAVVASTPAHGV